MTSVLEYKDYQKFLTDWIHSKPKKGRGIKLSIASYLGITPQQVSKVLNENTHLTLDQSAKLISYLDLSGIEGKYFLGLVELARAGSLELREIVQERLDEYKMQWESPTRTGIEKKTHTLEEMEVYFSSYLYDAIDLITTLEKYQTPGAISQYFNISKKKTLEILSILVKLGALKKEGDKFIPTGELEWLELPKNIAKINTTNWRNRAIASLDYDEEVNNHQTLNFTVNRKAIPKIKKHIFDSMLDMSDKYLKEGNTDMICAICVDLFEIK